MKQIDGGITAVPGVRAAGVHAGIKAADAKDVALIVTDTPATAAGVFTKNSVTAAPVIVLPRASQGWSSASPLLSIVETPTLAPVRSAWQMPNGWRLQPLNNSV